MKASHTFNLLDARGAISVTERQRYILRVRALARAIAQSYVQARAKLGFPMAEPHLRDEVLAQLQAQARAEAAKSKRTFMSNPYSIAHYGINDERKSITLALQNGQWSSIANNTKWTELISAIRNDDWHPSYRFCWISNRFISSWDAEWHHHLPYPFAGVLWFDMSTLEHQIRKDRSLNQRHICQNG